MHYNKCCLIKKEINPFCFTNGRRLFPNDFHNYITCTVKCGDIPHFVKFILVYVRLLRHLIYICQKPKYPENEIRFWENYSFRNYNLLRSKLDRQSKNPFKWKDKPYTYRHCMKIVYGRWLVLIDHVFSHVQITKKDERMLIRLYQINMARATSGGITQYDWSVICRNACGRLRIFW